MLLLKGFGHTALLKSGCGQAAIRFRKAKENVPLAEMRAAQMSTMAFRSRDTDGSRSLGCITKVDCGCVSPLGCGQHAAASVSNLP